jgi:hypothetical protein
MPTHVTTSSTSLGTQLSTLDLKTAEYQRLVGEKIRQVEQYAQGSKAPSANFKTFTAYQLDVSVNMSEKSLGKKYATTVTLDDGTRLTVSMNIDDAARINAEQANSMFWQVPCKQEGNAVPRTLAQVQECKCLVCQAACATILKWRMMK